VGKLKQVNWIPALWITLTPLIALYGIFTTKLTFYTFIWTIVGYLISGLGITVGYHRLFAHKSFTPNRFLKYIILACGTSAFQGSCLWWARDHRAHHRYVDTDKDPYNIKRGFFYSHMGWLLVKQDKAAVGKTDCHDLETDPVLIFQDKHYLILAILSGIVFPVLVAGLGWGDWRGGFYYACILKSVIVLQSTFCVNSLAHYVGDHTFSDVHTPRDCFWVSLVTLGEGYHNFHHEFPYDYRNGVKWYAYDPSKWIIWTLSLFGFTYNLKRFPANEIKKGELQMLEKKIEREKKKLSWGKCKDTLPAFTRADVQRRVDEGSSLLIIDGYVIDVAEFADYHPGGKSILNAYYGKDATRAFTGAVYDHSNGAKNLITSLRVGYIIDN